MQKFGYIKPTSETANSLGSWYRLGYLLMCKSTTIYNNRPTFYLGVALGVALGRDPPLGVAVLVLVFVFVFVFVFGVPL